MILERGVGEDREGEGEETSMPLWMHPDRIQTGMEPTIWVCASVYG